MSKTICFYHSADLDGHCAGAIVKKAIKNELSLIGINYNYKTNDHFETIDKDDTVIIVDFTFKPLDMLKLKSLCKEIIWIDHHKTAISDSIEFNYSDYKGARDISKSGCELTWGYFYPDYELPLTVHLLGRYDLFDVDDDNRVFPFQYGVRYIEKDTRPFNDRFWSKMLPSFYSNEMMTSEMEDFTNDILYFGNIIFEYQMNQYKKFSMSSAFEFKYKEYNVIACNVMMANSKLFDSVFIPAKHDLMLTFSFNGNNWYCTFYSPKTSNIDVSQLAKEFGGGGHEHAAGFIVDKLPFDLF